MVTETTRARKVGQVDEAAAARSVPVEQPASAAPVETFIIVFLCPEFVECRPARACFLQSQL